MPQSTFNFKTDDSFFTTVLPPFTYYGTAVKQWLEADNVSRFRFIRDIEIDKEFWNLEQVDDIYPGIKSITIAINPWARMRYAYLSLCHMKDTADYSYLTKDILDMIPLDTFKDFIISLQDTKTVEPFWFALGTPVSDWIQYTKDGCLKEVDYILRDSHLAEDFKVIQDYFCTDRAFILPEALSEYSKHYDETTKTIIAELFKKDIEKFGYTFEN